MFYRGQIKSVRIPFDNGNNRFDYLNRDFFFVSFAKHFADVIQLIVMDTACTKQ